MDNFGKDPWAGGAMIQTAENVSREHGVTLRRVRRHHPSPAGAVPGRARRTTGSSRSGTCSTSKSSSPKKKTITVAGDEAPFPST